METNNGHAAITLAMQLKWLEGQIAYYKGLSQERLNAALEATKSLTVLEKNADSIREALALVDPDFVNPEAVEPF